MPTILVSGALANKPHNGGNSWTRLSWVTGFRRLGFDVVFVEQLAGGADVGECTQYFRTVMASFGLTGSSALLDATGERLEGLAPDRVKDAAEQGRTVPRSSAMRRPSWVRRLPLLGFV